MYETHTMPLASKQVFFQRLFYSFTCGVVIIILAIAIGMIGYHHFENLSWLDAFLNASMILSGMGPVAVLTTESGKLFAGFYALFSGLAFMVILGVVFAPVAHRLYHKFHLDKNEEAAAAPSHDFENVTSVYNK